MSTFFKQIITLGILMALFFAVQLLAFTEPTLAPPAGNVPTTFNVGPDAQVKEGGVILGNLSTVVNGLAVRYGNVGIGTLTPQRLVHLKTDNAGTPSMLALENINLGINNGSTLSFRGKVSDGTEFKEFAAVQTVYEDHTSTARKGSLNLFSSIGVINGTPQITIKSDGMIDVKSNRIVNLPLTPVDDTDAVSKAYVLAQTVGGKSKSQEFKTVGASTFTPSAGVTLVWVTVVGGGGGGVSISPYFGGGGGGEVIIRFPVQVTPGVGVPVIVGVGGNGRTDACCSTAIPGGSSSFGSVTAGGGGISPTTSTGGPGGPAPPSSSASRFSLGRGGAGGALAIGGDGTFGGFSSGGGGGGGSDGVNTGFNGGAGARGSGGAGYFGTFGSGGGGGSWGPGANGRTSAAPNTGGGGGGASAGVDGGSGYVLVEWIE